MAAKKTRTGYVVGGTRWFPTLEEALKSASDIFNSTGIIVSVVKA